jgi:DNA primase large subunit
MQTVLKEIENIYRRTQDKNEIQQETEAACRKYMKLTSIKNDASAQNERRRDHISHFILRLAYSRT